MARRDVLIIGGGGFGGALAYLLGQLARPVDVYDNDPSVYDSWKRIRCINKYPHLEETQLTEWVEVLKPDLHTLPAQDYRFVIVATPTAAIVEALEHLDMEGCATPIVLTQKGMTYKPGDDYGCSLIAPRDQVQRILPYASIMQFTGAAFAEDIMYASRPATKIKTCLPIGMLIGCDEKDAIEAAEFAELFRETGIWPHVSHNTHAIAAYNTLRTVASFEAGVVSGFLEGEKNTAPTLSLALSALSYERHLLAAGIWGDDGAVSVVRDDHRLMRIFDADLDMCNSVSSRNFNLGYLLGKGVNLHNATQEAAYRGTIEAQSTIQVLGAYLSSRGLDWPKQYPYLGAVYNLINGRPLAECIGDILDRRDAYFKGQ